MAYCAHDALSMPSPPAVVDASNDHFTILSLPVNVTAANEKATMQAIEQMQDHIAFARYQFFLRALVKHWPAQLESLRAKACAHGDLGWVQLNLNFREGTSENVITNKSNTFRTAMDAPVEDGFLPLLNLIDKGFDEGALVVTKVQVPHLLDKVMDVSLRQRWMGTVLPAATVAKPKPKL